MNRFKEALVQFAHSNPNLFPQNHTNYPALIDQQFSKFFTDIHTPNHPPYAAMINRAIQDLKEKGGSSEESISKYIEKEFVDLPWAHSTLLKHHLEKLCDLKEIVMTHKKCYLLVGEDSDPVSSTTPEKQLKVSETGNKSSQSGKKQKNREDLKLGKTSSGKGKKGKKQKSRLDSESAKTSSKHHKSYKKKGKVKQITEVCQKEDQVIQALDEVAGEQEKHDVCIDQEMGEGGVCANATEQNQTEKVSLIKHPEVEVCQKEDQVIQALDEVAGEQEKHGVCIDQEMGEGGVCANATEQNQTEKVSLIKHSEVTDSEDQSVERSNDKEQIRTRGTKKRKDKKWMIMPKRSSKRIKKNEETQLQVLSEVNLNLDEEITDGASQEQKQMIEVNTSDTQIQEENMDVEMALELHSDKSGDINLKQIQMEQSPPILELEESPNSNHILQKNGKQIWTRSQRKSMSKKDPLAGSELTGSPGNANMPKDKLDVVEHLSEEKQQVPSAVSTIMISQRAKLRSSQKSTVIESFDMEMEPQQKSRITSLKNPLLELVEPAQVQEADNTQQDQQPDELEEFKPKPKGRGRPPKKSKQASKKVKVGNRRVKPKRDEDKVTGKSRSTNKKDRPKKRLPGKHKMARKISKKKKKPGR